MLHEQGSKAWPHKSSVLDVSEPPKPTVLNPANVPRIPDLLRLPAAFLRQDTILKSWVAQLDLKPSPQRHLKGLCEDYFPKTAHPLTFSHPHMHSCTTYKQILELYRFRTSQVLGWWTSSTHKPALQLYRWINGPFPGSSGNKSDLAKNEFIWVTILLICVRIQKDCKFHTYF